jgi:hypothetical protein
MKAFVIILALLSFCCYAILTFGTSVAADKPGVVSAQVNKTQAAPPLKNPDIQAIKPKKPVKIKLHRSQSGQYSWDISGDSADEVFRADSRLRKLLKSEDKKD